MQSTLQQYFAATKSGVESSTKHALHLDAAGAPIKVDNGQPNPFDSLPIEMNQRIAEFLPNERSILEFVLTCRSARDAVERDGGSFWRRRFLATFDKPRRSVSNAEYKEKFVERGLINFHLVTFSHGHSKAELKCLKAIRDIIVDSFSEASQDAIASVPQESNNIAYLLKILQACPSLLHSIFAPQVSAREARDRGSKAYMGIHPVLETVQVLLTPYMMRQGLRLPIYQISDSQRQAYMFMPVFKGCFGLDIDMEWVLHQVNYWRYHCTVEEEYTLHQAFSDLDSKDQPQFWQSSLKNESNPTIGRHWKGSYAYLERDDVEEIREHGNPTGGIQDYFCGPTGADFQDMELELSDEGEETWQKIFEHFLQSIEEPKKRMEKARALKRSSRSSHVGPIKNTSFESSNSRIRGVGKDESAFLTDGWMNTLPSQNGVSGWKRVTMMKYFVEDDTNEVNYDALWAYEGIMLPGGKVIVGRWWSASADGEKPYSGPFILWCTDTPERLRQYEEIKRNQEKVKSQQL